MVRLLALTAALTTALALAGTASAESLQVKHKPWHTLTTQQKVVVLKKQIRKDNCVIRFWKNHRELASASTAMGYKARTQTHWARVSKRIASKHLQALQALPLAGSASGFPPHHALWMCLHSVEAGSWYDRDSGGSQHYGGLQMSYNWGNGIVGYAYNYSQAEQEWAAERGYRKGGPSFVYDQWLKWEHGVGDKCIRFE